jgi:hypothetical protein
VLPANRLVSWCCWPLQMVQHKLLSLTTGFAAHQWVQVTVQPACHSPTNRLV